MICQNCGEEMPVGETFCKKCDANIDAELIECQNCGNKVEVGALFCSNCGEGFVKVQKSNEEFKSKFCEQCGKALMDDANFCKYCGTKVNIKSQEDLNLQSEISNTKDVETVFVYDNDNTSKSGVGFCLGFFLGIIGLVIGLCLYSKSHEKETFIKGWVISFVIVIIASIIIGIIYANSLINLFDYTIY